MTLPTSNKTRLSKRKLEIKEVRKEKQTVTSKKHDKYCFKDKHVEDSEDVNLLKQLNDALLEEVKDNEKTIEALKKKEKKYEDVIKDLKLKEDKSKQNTKDAGCQTNDSDLIFCEECEFPAETLYELGEHVGEFHSGLRIPCNFCDDIYPTKKGLEEHEVEVHKQLPEHKCNVNQEEETARDHHYHEIFKCRFCDESFQTKRELMRHNKIEHEENLRSCWNYAVGTCFYDKDCWYSHEKQNFTHTRQYKCNFCGNDFQTEPELFKHKKCSHSELVPVCKNFLRNNCSFENDCWFSHEKKTEEKSIGKNEDMLLLEERLIKMVEKLTTRIEKIESK